MAMNRLIRSAIEGTHFPLFGDGSQIRDFTYVTDVVEANILAAVHDLPTGFVANVAGGSPASMSQVIDRVTELVGTPPVLDRREARPGDVHRTGGSTSKIRSTLGWFPRVSLEYGLESQIAWHLDEMGDRAYATASPVPGSD